MVAGRPPVETLRLALGVNISRSFARFSRDWSFARLFRIFQEFGDFPLG
jgi:hypothetical protein